MVLTFVLSIEQLIHKIRNNRLRLGRSSCVGIEAAPNTSAKPQRNKMKHLGD
jgi:hypothetical protein